VGMHSSQCEKAEKGTFRWFSGRKALTGQGAVRDVSFPGFVESGFCRETP
jgi:hypothetical protein